MKILIQDRQAIVEITSDIWATPNGKENYTIFRNGSDEFLSQLGSYTTKERAMEVLEDLFKNFGDGKSTYIMPLK